MNRRKYGIYIQNKVADALKQAGYCVHNQKPVAKKIITKEGEELWISQRNDIFGLFDIIAVNQECILFIQVSADSHIKRKFGLINMFRRPETNILKLLVILYNQETRSWRVMECGNEDKDTKLKGRKELMKYFSELK